MPGFDAPVLIAALMAGLLGSGHCFAMCGGIAGSLGVIATTQSRAGSLRAALQFNLGRLLGYASLGALTGALAGFAPALAAAQGAATWLRWLTAAAVALIGLRLLTGWGWLAFAERGGTMFWRRIAPFAVRAAARPGIAGRLLTGLCWAFLPCGLVYSSLLLAASTGSAIGGAASMLAFGAGTLPALLGLGMTAPALSALLSDCSFRRFAGFGLLVLALWMAVATTGMLSGHEHAMH